MSITIRSSTLAYAKSESTDIYYASCTEAATEALINKIENEVYSKYTDKLEELLSEEKYAAYNQLSLSALQEKNAAVVDALAEFGATDTTVTINQGRERSTSTQLTFSETISTIGDLRFYSCDWVFTAPYDKQCDINDIAATRITDSENYYINSSYAKTWTGGGTQTGYVDNTGNHDPTDSPVTKRYEDATGVMFNINDYVISSSTMVMLAAKGRISVYVGKKSGVTGSPQCKILTDYHHNYKSNALELKATIGSVGFTGITGQLSVSYTRVNKQWQRASGGKFF